MPEYIVIIIWGVIRTEFNVKALLNLGFLSIICSVAAYYLWNKAIEGIGVKITSNLILFMSLVSIIAGIVSFGEKLTLQIMVSAVLLLSGVWLASKTPRGEEF